MTGIGFLSVAQMAALAAAFLMQPTSAAPCPNPEKVPQTMLSIVENDNGRALDIRVGELIRIDLPENATTGYRWAIDRYDEALIEAQTNEPCYPATALGSGGEVGFIFQGKKIGTGEIVLKHWRHWEGDSSVTRRFHIRINVRL